MKLNGLLIAAIVLAALTGTLYWSNHRKPADTSASAASDLPPRILSLNSQDVTSVALKKKSGESLVLTKNTADKWEITAPKPLPADQDSVSSMLSTLSTLNADRLIEEKTTTLDQYGLNQPVIEVDITDKNKKLTKLLIGDDTPAGSAAYAALSGDPRVFSIANYNKNAFVKTPADLRDKRLLTFDSDKVSKLELTAKKQSVEFGRSKDQWQIVKPKPARADQTQVEDVVRTLRDIKMDLGGTDDEKKIAAAFSSGAPTIAAKITDASGNQELQIRKNKDDYYAKSTAVAGIFKILSGTASSLEKSPDDFRNKKLFDFGFNDPDKIEIHDGAKAYFLTRSGPDWWSNGVKMDVATVSSLIDQLRDLSASKFPDSGYTWPALEITVTSKDGKSTEKVAIAKAEDRYIAKRENEPALYELSVPAITQLQKSAAEIKPAETKPADAKSTPAKK
jgi:Domain of unknown function (DUF4340)